MGYLASGAAVVVVRPGAGGRGPGYCPLAAARWGLLGRTAGAGRMRLLLGIVGRAVSRRTRGFNVTNLGWNRLQCYTSLLKLPRLNPRRVIFCR